MTLDLLNHFINWELSNSLPFKLLASILSKKFTAHMLNLISNPEFLNYYILTSCISENKKNELKLENYSGIKIVHVTDETVDLSPVKTENSVENSIKISKKPEIDTLNDENKEFKRKPPKLATIKPPQVRQNNEMTEEVKIYEPKSCKTWYDSYDLESVTLGQDILDIMDSSEKDTG